MANFLESLIAEWYQYKRYFVLQNVKVGRRARGGYDTELDIVAYSPPLKRILHIEASTDSDTWPRREQRYAKKFGLGREHIPSLLGLATLEGCSFEQQAIFVYVTNLNRRELAGGRIVTLHEFFSEMKSDLTGRKVAKEAVPEVFPLVRAVQFTVQYGSATAAMEAA